MREWRGVGIALCLLAAPRVMVAQAAATEPAVATVNGEAISQAEWVRKMEGLRGPDFVASVNPLRFKPARAGQVALDTLISVRLLMQYASRLSLVPSTAEVDADLQRAKAQPAIKQALDSGALTEDQVRDQIRAEKTLYNVVTTNKRVTPEEVKTYYDSHPEQFGRIGRWRLAVIRGSTQATLDKVQAALKSGTPFATVATQLSEDENTRKNGGELPLVAVNDPAIPAFIRDAAGKLKAGEVSAPLRPAMGNPTWFLVRLLAKEDADVRPLEQVREQAERLALYEKAGGPAEAQKRIEEFGKTAKIVVLMKGYEFNLKSK